MDPQNPPKPVMDVTAPPRPTPPAVPPVHAAAPPAPVSAPAPTPPAPVVPAAPRPVMPAPPEMPEPAMKPMAVQPLPRDPLASSTTGAEPDEPQPEISSEEAAVHNPELQTKPSTAPVGVIITAVLVMVVLMGLAVAVYIMSNRT